MQKDRKRTSNKQGKSSHLHGSLVGNDDDVRERVSVLITTAATATDIVLVKELVKEIKRPLLKITEVLTVGGAVGTEGEDKERKKERGGEREGEE